MPLPDERDLDDASEQTPLLGDAATERAVPAPANVGRADRADQHPTAAAAAPGDSRAAVAQPPRVVSPRGHGVVASSSGRNLAETNTNPSWGKPAGLEPRKPNDDNLVIFRHAVGINSQLDGRAEPSNVEQGRKTATGIYLRVLKEERSKTFRFHVINTVVNTCHVVQILVGAALTTLGPGAASHTVAITTLGAANTVIAGLLALFKSQGLPERMHKDAVEFRRLKDWIEETDALLATGIIGRNRKEVGMLVESAFKKYNAVLASEEINKPDNYVRQQPEEDHQHEHEQEPDHDNRPGTDCRHRHQDPSVAANDDGNADGAGNAIVRSNVR
ncbi:hypothetical protein SPI_04671 [Niveomyces insectorum RCEF 264]|uniref:SMODS and SLOG-associating 2TM effector domain-containing protein n=1 Tax=Niveomyces insectorum RCEF 264 TaxID=1081102 RepID=A0A167UQU6_9HYPO|nr:hypothetical protein SPI_04671 [Niveomyces insectorum RCEF 264]